MDISEQLTYRKETILRLFEDNQISLEGVAAHKNGRMIDGTDIVEGEGPMAPARAGALPAAPLIRMCFSGRYSEKEMLAKCTKSGDLVDLTATADAREICDKGLQGDRYAKLVWDAMIYQISKSIGAMAAVLHGNVDGILLGGGMVYNQDLVELYSGMADMALSNDDEDLYKVCKNLFMNIVNQRMYITGGVGSTHRGCNICPLLYEWGCYHRFGRDKGSTRAKTQYPLDGSIEIITNTQGDFTLALRIPGWSKAARTTINGQTVSTSIINGYAYIKRSWQAGDKLTLDLAMEVKVLEASSKVIDLCGRAAVTRGPLDYCAEAIDNPYELRDVRISRCADYEYGYIENNEVKIPTITIQARVREEVDQLYYDEAVSKKAVLLKLISYFAWANRGVAEMTTWFLLDETK